MLGITAAHPLDNPILESLKTTHARFAQIAGTARRFDPAVSPLAGVEHGEVAEGVTALAELAKPGEACGLFLEKPLPDAPGWTILMQVPLFQMVRAPGPVSAPDRALLDLGEADAAEMLALARVTRPGPFTTRTRELGDFLGIREENRLAAMTGERLRLPGYTEMSAVCTHPEHLGRGHAAALMAGVAARIAARGETAFLHVLPQNTRAIELYERLGFTGRRVFTYVSLHR